MDPRRFADETIENRYELAVALFFGRNPFARAPVGVLAARTGLHPEHVEPAAESLAAKGVLRRRVGGGDDLVYGLTFDETLRQATMDLAEACRRDPSLERELAPALGQTGPQWAYETLLSYLAFFPAVRRRVAVLLQFLLMSAVAALLRAWPGLPDGAIARSLGVIAATTAWSAVLVLAARAVRRVGVLEGAEERSVLRRYRAWVFPPRRAEVLPGLVFLAIGMWAVVRPIGGAPSLLHQWLGAPLPPVVWPLLLLLAWDLSYRLGVGLWIVAAALWRAAALRRLWPRPLSPSPGHMRLCSQLRDVDETLLLVPVGYATTALVFADHPFLALGSLGLALLTALAMLVTGLLSPYLTPEARRAAVTARAARTIPLQDGAEVAVIGGGPAGSLFAALLCRYAREAGRRVNVTIYDGKDFHLHGPPGCNMCAGVISVSLSRRLAELGFGLRERVVQSRVRAFELHTRWGSVRMEAPDPRSELVTVFRGAGPRRDPSSPVRSFDDHLLHWARHEGARVVRQPVTRIALPPDPDERVTVAFGVGGSRDRVQSDLVVGAFGLNTRLLSSAAELGFGYRPPEVRQACNAELAANPAASRDPERIHVFCLGVPEVSFAALTPKSRHLTMTVVGQRDMKRPDLLRMLQRREIQAALDGGVGGPVCHCHPALAVRDAEHAFTDRMVMVGDACCSRLYKNGLESALDTATWAARTAIDHGVSWDAFATYYYPQCYRQVVSDNRYGRILFRLNDIVQRHPTLTAGHLRLVREDSRAGAELRQILWDLFTGAAPYRRILRRALSPSLQGRLWWHIAAAALGRRDDRESRPLAAQHTTDAVRPPEV